MLERQEDDGFAEAVVAAARDQGAAGWIAGREAAFVAFVRARRGGSTVAELRIGDLALVFGCVSGQADALRAFDARILANLGWLLRRESDLKQDLVTRLFVRWEGRAPRALAYSGAGPLSAWVRRTALNLVRSAHRKTDPPTSTLEDEAALSSELGPEKSYAAHEGSSVFLGALAVATRAIGERNRELLRLSGVEQRSIQEIAAHFGVHRETAGRWVADARRALARETQTHLRSTLQIDDHAADAIIEESIAASIASLGRILSASASASESTDESAAESAPMAKPPHRPD